MLKNPCGLVVLSLAALAFCAGPAWADDDQAPDPLKVLRIASKNLAQTAKKQGYTTSVEVEGGLSKTADHRLHMTTVRESYSGEIRGDVMHVPAMQVFRTSDKGALFDGVNWAALQARAEGKKLDRLFAFPIQLLATAVQKPESVEWLASTEEAPVIEEEGTSGHTAVVKKRSQDQIYHRMRVQVPDEEALQYFVEVQNSGCLSGG
jgi:hypothetical protein